jgi:hypothetical protein
MTIKGLPLHLCCEIECQHLIRETCGKLHRLK